MNLKNIFEENFWQIAMRDWKKWGKVVILALLIGGITYLHYFTFPDMRYHHAVYRMLHYLPLVLGSFWFGLKGAMYILISVFILYFPYMIKQWQGLSLEDFSKLLEGMLYIIIAFTLGFLVEKERKKTRTLLRAESLAAVGRAVSDFVVGIRNGSHADKTKPWSHVKVLTADKGDR
jgi:K+-sensing histidine kinase KdpD